MLKSLLRFKYITACITGVYFAEAKLETCAWSLTVFSMISQDFLAKTRCQDPALLSPSIVISYSKLDCKTRSSSIPVFEACLKAAQNLTCLVESLWKHSKSDIGHLSDKQFSILRVNISGIEEMWHLHDLVCNLFLPGISGFQLDCYDLIVMNAAIYLFAFSLVKIVTVSLQL